MTANRPMACLRVQLNQRLYTWDSFTGQRTWIPSVLYLCISHSRWSASTPATNRRRSSLDPGTERPQWENRITLRLVMGKTVPLEEPNH